jgi:hypothetical protein
LRDAARLAHVGTYAESSRLEPSFTAGRLRMH